MLEVRVHICTIATSNSLNKHHPRALRTKHNPNETNVVLQNTLLVQFYTKSIFKAIYISSVHLLALIPAVAEPT
jgi:hypothetical protein